MPKPLTRREFRFYRKTTSRALELQAKKIEMRLIGLNGEHKTNIENWAQSVRQELFQEVIKAIESKIEVLNTERDERRGVNALFRTLAGAGAIGFVISLARLFGWVH